MFDHCIGPKPLRIEFRLLKAGGIRTHIHIDVSNNGLFLSFRAPHEYVFRIALSRELQAQVKVVPL